jgi:hypothetical protein
LRYFRGKDTEKKQNSKLQVIKKKLEKSSILKESDVNKLKDSAKKIQCLIDEIRIDLSKVQPDDENNSCPFCNPLVTKDFILN